MRLLVGINRSDGAHRVLEPGIERARSVGDDLSVAVLEPDESSTEQLEQEVHNHLSDMAFDADVHALSGHPGSQLVDFAEREGFDQIVIDGGRTSPLGKIQLDDVAEFVLLNATTTVTLLR